MLAATLALMLMASGADDNQSRSANPSRAEDDPDRLICRAAEPVLGSRIARRRICRTVAQWRTFEADRAQLRRDLQNAARDGSIEQ